MKVDNEYQKFFRHERFTHHITLPPSYLNEKSVLPVLRKIEFKLNKTFLKSAFCQTLSMIKCHETLDYTAFFTSATIPTQ